MPGLDGEPPLLGNHRELVSNYLDQFVAKRDWVRFVCVCTADGRTVDFRNPRDQVGHQQLSAMTSAYVALGESFSRNTIDANFTHSVIVTTLGAIVAVRVPTTNGAYVLSLASDASETLAMTLRASLDAAEALAGHLQDGH